MGKISKFMTEAMEDFNNWDFFIATPIVVIILRQFVWSYVYEMVIIQPFIFLSIELPFNFIVQTYISSILGAITFLIVTKITSLVCKQILKKDWTQSKIVNY